MQNQTAFFLTFLFSENIFSSNQFMRDFHYCLFFLTGFIGGGACGFPIERKRYGTVWRNAMTVKQKKMLKRKNGRRYTHR